MRALAGAGLLLWVGFTLLLAELRWFRRPPMVERLGPYLPGGYRDRAGVGGVETIAGLAAPLARTVGARISRLVGVSEDLGRRLRRIHSPLDVTGFRVRQLGWSLAGFGAGCLAILVLRPPLPVVALFVLGLPLLAFLSQEQRVATASDRWQRRVFLELPVVAEQLAMLVGAGYSLGGALHRLVDRGDGACAQDLCRVLSRVDQGLGEDAALREWADTVEVPAADRLVRVLELNRQSSDLGTLLSGEARAIRREVHRELLETIDRRAQQVWIPVTVATLLPGVIFISIPFLSALDQFRSL